MEYFQLKYHKQIATCVFQSLIGYVCLTLMFSVSLHFSKTLKIVEITGIGLAMAIVHFIIIPLGNGFNQCLNINVSQAMGEGNRELSMKYLNITIYTHLINYTIFGVIVYYSLDYWTILIVEDKEEVIIYAKIYYVYTLLATMIFSVYESQKLFLIANKIFTPFKYIHIFTTIMHAFWCWYLLKSGAGMVGLGIATIITQSSNLLSIIIYILVFQRHLYDKFTLKFIIWEFQSFYLKYLQNAFSNVVHIMADFLIFAFMNILSFQLGNTQVNAQIMLTNTSALYFTFPLCTSIAMQTFVGNELGKNDIKMAKTFGWVSMIQFAVIQSIILIINWIFKMQWAQFYTNNPSVISELLRVFPYFISGFLILDGYQICLTGFLKGSEKANLVAISTLVSYYLIGLPSMVILTFHYELGLIGIWAGFAIGNFFILIFYIYTILSLNYKEQVQIIMEKVRISKHLSNVEGPSIQNDPEREQLIEHVSDNQ